MIFNCPWKRLLWVFANHPAVHWGGFRRCMALVTYDRWQLTCTMWHVIPDLWQGGYGMLVQCNTVSNVIFTQFYFVGMISKIELSCLMVVSTKQQSTPLPRQSPNSKLEIPSFVCLSRNWRGFIKLSLLDRVPTPLHSPLLHWSLSTGLGSLFSTFRWY